MGHYVGIDSLLCALVYIAPVLAVAINAFACECKDESEERKGE